VAEDKNTRWDPHGQATTYSGKQYWSSRHQPFFKEDSDARGKDDVASPVGEWTKVECLGSGSRITVTINSHTVNECTDTVPAAGKILLQSEGDEVFFRNLLGTASLAAGAAADTPAAPAPAHGKPTVFQHACMAIVYGAFPLERALTAIASAGYRFVAWGTKHSQGAAEPVPVMAEDAPPEKPRARARGYRQSETASPARCRGRRPPRRSAGSLAGPRRSPPWRRDTSRHSGQRSRRGTVTPGLVPLLRP
jgi:hypothetical protein